MWGTLKGTLNQQPGPTLITPAQGKSKTRTPVLLHSATASGSQATVLTLKQNDVGSSNTTATAQLVAKALQQAGANKSDIYTHTIEMKVTPSDMVEYQPVMSEVTVSSGQKQTVMMADVSQSQDNLDQVKIKLYTL